MNTKKSIFCEWKKCMPLSSNFSRTFMTSYCWVICTFLQNTMIVAACSTLMMKMLTCLNLHKYTQITWKNGGNIWHILQPFPSIPYMYSNLLVIDCDLFLTYLWQTRNKNLAFNEYDRPDYSWLFVMVKGQKLVIFHCQW